MVVDCSRVPKTRAKSTMRISANPSCASDQLASDHEPLTTLSALSDSTSPARMLDPVEKRLQISKTVRVK
jgi:hypothetical protein